MAHMPNMVVRLSLVRNIFISRFLDSLMADLACFSSNYWLQVEQVSIEEIVDDPFTLAVRSKRLLSA